MFNLLLTVCVWIIFAIVFIDKKNIKKYYPTLLYYMVINKMYNFLYYNHSLWTYTTRAESLLNHTIISLVYICFIIPVGILIYLQLFPEEKNKSKKISYILVWAVFYSSLEYLFLKQGMFEHHNGWGIIHSFVFDILMFSMIYLHYKKPFRAIMLTIIILITFLLIFPVPLSSMK